MNKFKIIISFLFAAIIFSGCNKYEDGPAISLLSAEKRIDGTYTLDKYYINDQELTLTDINISEYKVTYNKDGSGTRTINGLKSDIQWEFDDKKENIREKEQGLTGEWSSWGNYRKLLKLTKDEIWILDESDLESSEFHFLEQ